MDDKKRSFLITLYLLILNVKIARGFMLPMFTQRPRNVDSVRAGAILYGDLGTSKAYVIGLALAVAGYSSFWLILAVSLLCILVGINYIIICRCYPNGGGVYASVRNRSEVISLVGAFFIVTDYVITAALSGLSAFSYFQLPDPVLWTCIAIAFVGGINFFGPRHTGKLAFYAVIFTLVCLVILIIFSIPHLSEAVHNIKPLKGGFWKNWENFVSVIVALSGVEAIANITGVMKLDPGSTSERPSVKKTASKAIIAVVLEVAIFTSIFSFVSLALHGMSFHDENVFINGQSIRDFVLRYLGEVFVSESLGQEIGKIFAWVISLAIGILLLSAVNTAINGFVSIQYLLSQDGEIDPSFQNLNRYGVPVLPLIVATIFPIVVLLIVRDIPGLASLYAIGFVGAIATNLTATSTDKKQSLLKWERSLMAVSAAILIAIEVTLFIVKPKARYFVLGIIAVGLIIRGLTREHKQRKEKEQAVHATETPPPSGDEFAVLCAVEGKGNALDYAFKLAKKRNCRLYLLLFKQQSVISDTDLSKSWDEVDEAKELFEWVKQHQEWEKTYFQYVPTDSAPNTIVEYTKKFEINLLVVDMSSKIGVFDLFHGNLIHEVKKILPKDVQILVIP